MLEKEKAEGRLLLGAKEMFGIRRQDPQENVRLRTKFQKGAGVGAESKILVELSQWMRKSP